MESIKEEQRYVMVAGVKVVVSDDVYRTINRARRSIRAQQYKAYQCVNPGNYNCSCECSTCPCYRTGILYSLDAFDYEKWIVAENNQECMEDMVASRELMEYVYSLSERLTAHGSVIMRMHFEEGISCREIASQIGISHTMVNKKLKLILERLKAQKDFLF